MAERKGEMLLERRKSMDELQILTINGVDCYERDGTAYLKLESVARGLGFSRIAASGNEVIRWETVRKYLGELGVPTSWHGDYQPTGKVGLPDFIPENIFYRLAMKAKNGTAEKFQAKVADEIIPSIRKHGAYMTGDILEKALASPDFLIQLATKLKEEQEQNKILVSENERMKPKEIFADAVAASKSSILIGELAKLLRQNGIDTGEKRLFAWMRQQGFLISRRGTDYNMPTQRSMERKLFEVKEHMINYPDGSVRITKTTVVTGKGQQYFINKFLQEQNGA